jgi:hypothetical protein
MADIRPFHPVKLVCGIIAAEDDHVREAEERLVESFGPVDDRGPRVVFAGTAYYEPEMGSGLRRGFIAFRDLITPESLPAIKIRTNALEDDLRAFFAADRRIVNLDPGYLTTAALILATAKDFSHRVPLKDGIFAHLELIFNKTGVKRLEWTYPDFRNEDHIPFFRRVRRDYLDNLKR